MPGQAPEVQPAGGLGGADGDRGREAIAVVAPDLGITATVRRWGTAVPRRPDNVVDDFDAVFTTPVSADARRDLSST